MGGGVSRRSVADDEMWKSETCLSCVCYSIPYPDADHFTQIQKLLTKPSLFSINNAFEIILTPISGRQVVVGGWKNRPLSSVETYPPLQEGCSIPALEEAREAPTLSILPGNRLVVCGGARDYNVDDGLTYLASCVSWTPGQEKWSSFATMRWQSLFAMWGIFDDWWTVIVKWFEGDFNSNSERWCDEFSNMTVKHYHICRQKGDDGF